MTNIFISSLLAVVFTLASSLVFAGKNDEKCRQWALEDGVPAAKIANYVRECNADQEAHSPPVPIFPPLSDTITEVPREKIPQIND